MQPPGGHALHQRDPVRLGRLQPHRGHRLCLDLHQRHPGGLRLPEVRVRRPFVPLLEAEWSHGINLSLSISTVLFVFM